MNDLVVAKLETCGRLLSECQTAKDAKQLSDIAEAARVYAKRAGHSVDVVNKAVEYKIRAERRLGEILQTTEKAKPPGSNQHKLRSRTVTEAPTLRDLGVSKKVSSRAQQIARIPKETFERKLDEARKESKELTTAEILREHAGNERREERFKTIREASDNAKPLTSGLGRFPVIYADPPWRYEHSMTDARKIENQYPTMALEDICNLKVRDVVTDHSILFMWATSPKLEESLRVLSAWGFTYRTNLVWVKDKIGMGYWARSRHELLLVGTRGEMPTPAPDKRPDSVIESPRGEHSEKPGVVYELIEGMFPTLQKLELFARTPRNGWKSWGNQL